MKRCCSMHTCMMYIWVFVTLYLCVLVFTLFDTKWMDFGDKSNAPDFLEMHQNNIFKYRANYQGRPMLHVAYDSSIAAHAASKYGHHQ